MQGFVKSLLDVGDNLERANGAVPPEALEGKDSDGSSLSTEKAISLLNGISNGLQLTEKIYFQVRLISHHLSLITADAKRSPFILERVLKQGERHGSLSCQECPSSSLTE